MNTKPEALRLSDDLDKTLDFQSRAWSAAKELRRLHEVNQMLVESLEHVVDWYGGRDKNRKLLTPKKQRWEIQQAMEALTKAKPYKKQSSGRVMSEKN